MGGFMSRSSFRFVVPPWTSNLLVHYRAINRVAALFCGDYLRDAGPTPFSSPLSSRIRLTR